MNSTEQLTAKAVEAYKNASDEGKKELEYVFGKSAFNISLIDRVNGYESLYREMNVDPKNYEPKSDDAVDIVGNEMKKIDLVYQFFRDGREPNMNDCNELHWIPVFDHEVTDDNPSGFRFLCSFDTLTSTFSVLGPLLVVFEEEISDHIARTFFESFRIIKTQKFNHKMNFTPEVEIKEEVAGEYFLQLKNEKQGIFIQINGEQAKEAKEVLQGEAKTLGAFEWGGMTIDTRDSDWKYRDSTTVGSPGSEPWFMMGSVVSDR